MLVLFLPRRLRDQIRGQPPLARLLNFGSVTLLLGIVFVGLFMIFEQTGPFDAIWQAWQTMTTVGYGDGPAKSVGGRLAVMLISVAGIAMLGATFNAYFEYRSDKQAKRRSGLLSNPFRDGYIIIQFPGEQRLLSLISEVRCLNGEREVPFCLIDRHIEELPSRIAGLGNIHFIRDSPVKRSVYDAARLRDQRTVVVFPPQNATDDADATTASIVSQVERYLGGQAKTGHIEVIYALVDESNRELFEGLSARSVLKSLDVLAIVQEAQDPLSSKVITELLSNSHGPNPVTVIPSTIVGWQWRELYELCPVVSADLDLNVMPLALIRDQDPMVSPPQNTVIARGDLITIVSGDNVDWNTMWQTFERELLAAQTRRNGP